ncbi:sugar kinase [Photobacterium sp. TY1-4]|uniref:sugar kinase n=1 Tax=Photobacterium sp. TY1-4 TaxID=2899122 RepID=UPI0021BED4F2|nr:sugar kinase [Photobacterium sp. TY1-4]UXI00201.1 sugar kinase [Photobacterium sp. TY1-4]
MKIAFFGECMVELSGQPLRRTFGGDTLNTALYLARLGRSRQLSVSYATALGTDHISSDMLMAWQEEHIDTAMVRRLEHKLPGLYLVETEPSGERHFHYWRNDSAAKFYFATALSPLEQAIQNRQLDVLCISGVSLAILAEEAKAILVTLLEQMKANGGRVVFDNNFRPQLWTVKQAQYWYQQALPYADLVIASEADERRIWGDCDVRYRYPDFDCDEVVVTRGSQPCFVYTEMRSGNPVKSVVAAKVLDTTTDPCAVGDAFAAGYLAGRLSGESATMAAELGHELAAIVIQHPGAIIPPEAMEDIL